MNKMKSLFAAVILLACTLSANAQAPTADYFVGKWNVLIKGTPNGDAKMVFVLDKKEDKIAGVIQDEAGQEVSKIDKAEMGAEGLTVYFTAQGYDVFLLMKKKDDDHLTGSLMNMFDAEGERVKVAAK